MAAFVGDANRVPGIRRGGSIETELGLLPCAVGDGDLALVRPEHVVLEARPDGAAQVVGVEYYGHDQAVTVRLPSGRLVRARLAATTVLQVGDTVRASATTATAALPSDASGGA